MITGHTRAAGVIGSPIRHSLSPTLFNAAFVASGLDWAYLAFEVPEGAAGLAMGGVRALGLEGLSVTMPHKAAVIPALDSLTEPAAALGAVNCISRRGTDLVGDNTDGQGFVDALRIDEGLDIAKLTFAVVGAGGAARAVIRALAQDGAREVAVINRSADKAEQAAALAGPVGRVVGAQAVSEADVVVNATPLGMGVVVSREREHEPMPVDPNRLAEGQVLVDLIYHPAVTPLLAAGRAKGLRTVNGLGMLIHQAAHAFRSWTQEDPPLEAMSAAVLASLVGERDKD